MKPEADCLPYEKFLMTDERFGPKAIDIWKNECARRLKPEHKGQFYDLFMNWTPAPNEVALYTLYAHADFAIPKKYDIIFNFKEPDQFVQTPLILTQCLYEAWLPTDKMDHGHKHLCIFEFENGLPEILDQLNVSNTKYPSREIPKTLLGICHSADFQEIRKRQAHYKMLKEKHGSNWWKYYEK